MPFMCLPLSNLVCSARIRHQWTSLEAEKEATASGHHLLPPLFSHGSALGLYSTLCQRPYLYRLTASSLLHCFFIPRANLEAVRDSDPSVEDFLWKVGHCG